MPTTRNARATNLVKDAVAGMTPKDFAKAENWNEIIESLPLARGVSKTTKEEVLKQVLESLALLNAISKNPKIPVLIRKDAAEKVATFGIEMLKRDGAGSGRGRKANGRHPEVADEDDDLADLANSLVSGQVPAPPPSSDVPPTEEEIPAGWGDIDDIPSTEESTGALQSAVDALHEPPKPESPEQPKPMSKKRLSTAQKILNCVRRNGSCTRTQIVKRCKEFGKPAFDFEESIQLLCDKGKIVREQMGKRGNIYYRLPSRPGPGDLP